MTDVLTRLLSERALTNVNTQTDDPEVSSNVQTEDNQTAAGEGPSEQSSQPESSQPNCDNPPCDKEPSPDNKHFSNLSLCSPEDNPTASKSEDPVEQNDTSDAPSVVPSDQTPGPSNESNTKPVYVNMTL